MTVAAESHVARALSARVVVPVEDPLTLSVLGKPVFSIVAYGIPDRKSVV